jgi:hypothetical protein
MTNQRIDRPTMGEETPLAVIDYVDQLEARIDAMQACIDTFEPVLENVRAVEGDFFERYSEYRAYRTKYDAITMPEARFILGEKLPPKCGIKLYRPERSENCFYHEQRNVEENAIWRKYDKNLNRCVERYQKWILEHLPKSRGYEDPDTMDRRNYQSIVSILTDDGEPDWEAGFRCAEIHVTYEIWKRTSPSTKLERVSVEVDGKVYWREEKVPVPVGEWIFYGTQDLLFAVEVMKLDTWD